MRYVLFGGDGEVFKIHLIFIIIFVLFFLKKGFITSILASRIKRCETYTIYIYIYIVVFSTATPAEYSGTFVGFVFTTVFRDRL